ncbi:hypothetical protein Pmani_020687 [Petrolisthes manimaculis]|uniref:Telomerase RNA component interacting RNase n=1 Tax=Petrolisthes manimaculis TaxID=1843537 RepID=A0AAE1PHV2_9EUCA|nr:hypothetical protein Pmani_020687 [Petrolisthes manimaculis]
MADHSSSQHQYSSSDSREDSQDGTKQQLGASNIFRNDGSFMEMFKKMQEEQKKDGEETGGGDGGDGGGGGGGGGGVSPQQQHNPTTHQANKEQPKKTTLSFVGKRRGGRILATGMVKKQRKEPQDKKEAPTEEGKTDAWSQYMNEVRKYKEQSCEEEGKRRPLVK